MRLGEWLNGRVAVSKTVGCVFESRLPCQQIARLVLYRPCFFVCPNTQARLTPRVACDAIAPAANDRCSVAALPLLTPRVSPANKLHGLSCTSRVFCLPEHAGAAGAAAQGVTRCNAVGKRTKRRIKAPQSARVCLPPEPPLAPFYCIASAAKSQSNAASKIRSKPPMRKSAQNCNIFL